jgi:hypothetical protein
VGPDGDGDGSRACVHPHPETKFDILKIGRMIAIAMNPTTDPIKTIMIGSIMLVTALIASFSAFA